jgi:hypothetical protein
LYQRFIRWYRGAELGVKTGFPFFEQFAGLRGQVARDK